MNEEQTFCLVEKDKIGELSEKIVTLGYDLESLADLMLAKAYDMDGVKGSQGDLYCFLSRLLMHFRDISQDIGLEIGSLKAHKADLADFVRRACAQAS